MSARSFGYGTTPNPLMTKLVTQFVNALTRNHGTNSCHGQQIGGPNATRSTRPAPRVLAAMTGVRGPFALRNRSGSPLVGTTAATQLQIGGRTKKTFVPAVSASKGHANHHHVPPPSVRRVDTTIELAVVALAGGRFFSAATVSGSLSPGGPTAFVHTFSKRALQSSCVAFGSIPYSKSDFAKAVSISFAGPDIASS